CREGVGRGEDREELRHEVDEHGDRPAPIWESAAWETSARSRLDALTFSVPVVRVRGTSGMIAHLAAHLGEEPSFGRREAVDAARRNLVEHPIDLRLRWIALGAAPPRRGAGRRRGR